MYFNLVEKPKHVTSDFQDHSVININDERGSVFEVGGNEAFAPPP